MLGSDIPCSSLFALDSSTLYKNTLICPSQSLHSAYHHWPSSLREVALLVDLVQETLEALFSLSIPLHCTKNIVTCPSQCLHSVYHYWLSSLREAPLLIRGFLGALFFLLIFLHCTKGILVCRLITRIPPFSLPSLAMISPGGGTSS